MTEQTAQTETKAAETTQPTPEKSKAELRREAEKALRQKKPDYKSAGVTLKVLKPNPKKVGSNAHAVFAQYKDGLTVADLLKMADDGAIKSAKGEVVSKSYVGACLMWDDRHGFIELQAPVKGEPAKPVDATQVKEVAEAAAEQPKA